VYIRKNKEENKMHEITKELIDERIKMYNEFIKNNIKAIEKNQKTIKNLELLNKKYNEIINQLQKDLE